MGTGTPVFPLDVNGKIGISGTQILYLPNQTTFTGSLVVGTGGGSLVNTTGNEGRFNTANGISALQSNTTGDSNTAIGYRAMISTTAGRQNTAVGSSALESNVSGVDNTAVGTSALLYTTGSWNTAVGRAAGLAITTGYWNTLMGRDAGVAMTTGFQNTGLGAETFWDITSGSYNVAVGFRSSYNLTSGSWNTTVGQESGYSGGSVLRVTAIGYRALFENTVNDGTAIGYLALNSNTTGARNTGLGYLAAYRTTTASDNVAVGWSALQANITGDSNTAIGSQAMSGNTTGIQNIAVGERSLGSNTTGIRNTAIGHVALNTGTNFSNAVALGYLAGYYASASNNVFLGASADVVDANKSGLITNAIAIGSSTKVAASRQLVIGADNGANYLTEAYFGSGVSASAPFAFRINSSGGRGTNIAGANLTLAAGISTGTGLGGSLIFQTAPAGSSGAIANTLATRMTIDATGNIGIGTTTPEQKLEVGGNIIASASGNVSLILRSLSAVSTDGQFTILSASTSDRLDIRRGSGTLAETLMSIASSGNVGIGTKVPMYKLSISANGTDTLGLNIDADNTYITAGKSLVISGSSPLYLRATTNGTIRIADDTNATVRLVTGGGNVGIGSSAPTAKLAVAGTASISGQFSLWNSASVSANLEVSGYASSSKMFGKNWTTAAGTPSSICQNATTGEITINAALSCTVSARDQKESITKLDVSARDLVMALQPEQFAYIDNPSRLRWGFIADEVQAVDPKLGDAYDLNGNARSIDLPALIALNTKAIQELTASSLRLDELLQPPTDNPPLTTNDGPLARLVKNILAYIADAFGFVVEEGRIRSDKLCAGTTCVDEQQLKRILQATNPQQTTDDQQTATPTPLPSSSVEPVIASDSATTPTPSPIEELPPSI